MRDSPQQNEFVDEPTCRATYIQWLGTLTWEEYLKISRDLLARVAPQEQGHFSSEAERLRFEEKLAGRLRMVAIFAKLDSWRDKHNR